ncbi:winged helix-turn-helix transcriptional regulator [Candidatus Nitrososphaera evergladensis]|uniref:winged helix-turn-helix transcriptional regulator n=1 Tax=Candidatus Nitrososphaera evergladensis TaxID=1459637 RepID=UPI00130EDBC7|nr:winged helix-turn-helix transcriptional regulator [Candidatus Nitrososphaera evergladensis]
MPSQSNARWSLIRTLAQTYALDILEALSKKPSRFSDLSLVSPNERTRAQRLKELESIGFISTVSLKVEKRYFVHYKLTDKGKEALQKMQEIDKLGG